MERVTNSHWVAHELNWPKENDEEWLGLGKRAHISAKVSHISFFSGKKR